MKSTGTFGDAELQEALASESKISVEQIQTIFSKLGINRKDQLAKFVW